MAVILRFPHCQGNEGVSRDDPGDKHNPDLKVREELLRELKRQYPDIPEEEFLEELRAHGW